MLCAGSFWMILILLYFAPSHMQITSVLFVRDCCWTIRNLTHYKENCVLLMKEDRTLSILKNLSKSRNDSVLINISVALLNMLHIEFCKHILLTKGIFALIFEIANIYNMDDPVVLPLLLCLLDEYFISVELELI